MTEEFLNWTIYFLIYSVLGYVLEVSRCSIIEKKLVNRGFLFGPWIPLYGFGVLLILVSTFPVRENVFLTFLVATFVCAVLEYSTSWVMEKIFKIKWWDYSKIYKYNLNGRICLNHCLAFGAAGPLIVYWFQPFLESLVLKIPFLPRVLIVVVFLVFFVLDVIASNYAVLKIKKTFDLEKFVGDQTNEIKRAARKIIKELFKKKRRLERKLERKRKKLQRKLEREKRKLERKLKRK